MENAQSLQSARPESLHIILSTIALSILSLALPVMTLQVYDRILPNPDSGTLPILIVGVTIALTVEICLRLARAWMIGWSGAVYEHALSAAAMKHILDADVSKASAYGIGDFLNRLTSISKLKDLHNGYTLMTIIELLFVPVFIGVIIYIAPPLAAIPVALLLAFAITTALHGKHLRETLEKRDEVDDNRYNFLIECLKGIHTVKAFAIEKLLSRRYETLQERSSLASLHAAEASTTSFNAGTTLSHLMMVVIMTVGAVFAINGHITTGALIASLQLSGRLMQPVQRALVLWAKYQDFHLAREKIDSIFALPLHQAKTRVGDLPKAQGKISLRNVSYGSVVKNVSLELTLGETISITGPAGSGKTALLDIMSGLYPPDSGEVLIDGIDVSCYAPEELSKHVGYMTTEGIIFRGTIRDNITCFGNIKDSKAQEVMGFLAVDRDVAQLPAGLDTMIQADGVGNVAPGLRQRIAMTRVLASRPKILLFDEADRSLDSAGYNLVFSMLAKLTRKTSMVLVSEDANIIGLASKHYVMKDGVLFEKTIMQKRTQS